MDVVPDVWRMRAVFSGGGILGDTSRIVLGIERVNIPAGSFASDFRYINGIPFFFATSRIGELASSEVMMAFAFISER